MTPPPKRGAETESEGGGDERLGGWAPPQPTDCKPSFNPAGSSKHDPNGAKAVAIRALFIAAKAIVRVLAEDEPKPQARRRRGETGKGFVFACRIMLRRAAKTSAAARGRYTGLRRATAPADAYARAGMYLSDTLDWLNLWQDNAANDQWLDEDFDTEQNQDYPQP